MPVAHTTVRGYKSRLTEASFFEGKDLAKVSEHTEGSEEAYVVADNSPAPFKAAAGARVLGFRYPGAKAPDNKTFFAVAPRRPPVVLAGVAGDYVDKLYAASMEADSLMATEQALATHIAPLAADDEVDKKFFSNPTITSEEKLEAVAKFSQENKLSEIITDMLNDVVQNGHTEHLKEITATFADLMQRVRCEATAEVTFGRIPTQHEVAQVKLLLSNLRSPTQYYVHHRMFVDPDIGGGLVVSMGDFELDGSLNTRCNEVHKHLVKSLQN